MTLKARWKTQLETFRIKERCLFLKVVRMCLVYCEGVDVKNTCSGSRLIDKWNQSFSTLRWSQKTCKSKLRGLYSLHSARPFEIRSYQIYLARLRLTYH